MSHFLTEIEKKNEQKIGGHHSLLIHIKKTNDIITYEIARTAQFLNKIIIKREMGENIHGANNATS